MKTDPDSQTSEAADENRNIMLYWDDGNPFPLDIISISDEWRTICPKWNVTLFNKETAYDFLLDNFGGDIARLFLTCGIPAMRSDFFRVFWAISKGGIYSDARYIPKREPLFFEPGKDLTLVRHPIWGFCNGIFFSKKDCTELKFVAYEIITKISKRTVLPIQRITGPAVWRIAIWNIHHSIFLKLENNELETSSIAVIDYETICRDWFHMPPHQSDTRGKEMHWSQLERYSGIYQRT